jgi:hypothetical protein
VSGNDERRRRTNKIILSVTGGLFLLILLVSLIPGGSTKTAATTTAAKTASAPTVDSVIAKLCAFGKTHPNLLGVGATGGDGSHSYLIVKGKARRFLPSTFSFQPDDVTTDTFHGERVISLYFGDNVTQVNFVGGVFNGCSA